MKIVITLEDRPDVGDNAVAAKYETDPPLTNRPVQAEDVTPALQLASEIAEYMETVHSVSDNSLPGHPRTIQ